MQRKQQSATFDRYDQARSTRMHPQARDTCVPGLVPSGTEVADDSKLIAASDYARIPAWLLNTHKATPYRAGVALAVTSTASRMGRPRLTEQRRAKILETAVQVISATGLCDVNVATIATRAEMSPALVLYYFGTKDRLLADTLLYSEERFYTRVSAELARTQGNPERLIRLLEITCLATPETLCETRNDWILWLELWARSLRDPSLASERQALDHRWREMITAVVSDGILSGDFVHPDPMQFATLLGALVDGLLIQILLKDPAVEPSWALQACLQFCARELSWAREARAISTTREAPPDPQPSTQ